VTNTDHVLCKALKLLAMQEEAAAKVAEVKKAAQEAADKLQAETKAADLKKAQEKAQVCLPSSCQLHTAGLRFSCAEYAQAALRQWPSVVKSPVAVILCWSQSL
jgi:hypothetical protein